MPSPRSSRGFVSQLNESCSFSLLPGLRFSLKARIVFISVYKKSLGKVQGNIKQFFIFTFRYRSGGYFYMNLSSHI